MLSPVEFGQVGIVMVFVFLGGVLVDSGISGALIRKDVVKIIDYSTILIFNVSIALFIILLIFFVAPFISEYFNDGSLQNLVRFSSILILVNSFQIVYRVRIVREMRFRLNSKYQITSVLLGAIGSVILAYLGFKTWAIISFPLLTSFLNLLAFLIFEKRIINKYSFSRESFMSVYKFGVNTTLASIFIIIFENIYQLVFGRFFLITDVGFFYQSKRLLDAHVGLSNSTISGVIYSYLSKLKDEIAIFRIQFHKIYVFMLVVLSFMLIITFNYSDLIVVTLFGQKWIESGRYLMFLSIPTFFISLDILFSLVFKIFDKTNMYLRLEIGKKIIQSILIGIGVYFRSIDVLLFGFIIYSILAFSLNFYFSIKVFEYSRKVYVMTLIKVLFSTFLAIAIGTSLVKFLCLGNYSSLYILPIMLLLFVCTLFFLKIETFNLFLVKNLNIALQKFIKK